MVGRHVCESLRAQGHVPVPISRATGYDVTKALDAVDAVQGADAVVDVTNVVATRRDDSIRFFETVTRNLADACARAGLHRYVLLSILGIDRVAYGYYDGKRRQEEVLAESGVPSSVLRATMFHEFAEQMEQRMSVGPVAFIPQLLCAPIAAWEVAAKLVELATAPSAPAATAIAGPATWRLVDMVSAVQAREGRRRLVVPVPVPGRAGKAVRDGALLPSKDVERGQEWFEEWLVATHVARSPA